MPIWFVSLAGAPASACVQHGAYLLASLTVLLTHQIWIVQANRQQMEVIDGIKMPAWPHS